MPRVMVMPKHAETCFCDGTGWYRESDPAGRGDLIACDQPQPTPQTDFDRARERYAQAKELLSLAEKAVIKTRTALLLICDHPNVISKEHYSPGSYFDRACWWTTNTCADCGEHLQDGPATTGGYG